MPHPKESASKLTDPDFTYGSETERLINPDLILSNETGEGLQLYDKMMNDAHIYSVTQTRKLAVLGKEWDIIPASEKRKDRNIAAFIKDMLEGANFEQARYDLLAAITHGFAVTEIIWGLDKEKRIVVKSFIGRKQRRFGFDRHDKLRHLTINEPIDGEPLPNKKFIVHRFGAESENPFGLGILSKLYWPFFFKRHDIKYWMIFLEKFGMPTVVGKYQGSPDETQKAAYLTALNKIQREAVLLFKDSLSVEFLEALRSGTASYEDGAKFLNAEISKAVLGQTLTTEMGETGSFAASKVHNEVRQDIVKADGSLLSGTLNDTVIKWGVDFNFANVEQYPKVLINTTPEINLNEQIKRDKEIASLVPVTQQYFYDTYSIPEPQEGEEIASGGKPDIAEDDPELEGEEDKDKDEDKKEFQADVKKKPLSLLTNRQ